MKPDSQNPDNTFICAICGKEFRGTRSDEDAMKELQENFGAEISVDDTVVVCDTCYKAITIDGKPINFN